MHPVSLDAALLRLQLPELILRPGMSLVARVASRGEGPKGAIVLAGQLIAATLPEGIHKGDTLRLKVAETSMERVVLQLVSSEPEALAGPATQAQSQAAQPASAPASPTANLAAQPLVNPLGAPPPELRDSELDPGEGGGRRAGAGERAAVSLAYDAPSLGRLDVRIERGPEGVVATVIVPAGAYPRTHARADALREALAARIGLPATVRIAARREPFDAYA